MDFAYSVLNELLVDAFNEINKVEEHSLKLITGENLSVTEIHTLEAVGDIDSKSMSEIAAVLKITVSTLTISINKLVNKGYVERFRIDSDRRVVKVQLTKLGRAAVEAHRRFHHKMVGDILELLNEKEVHILIASIERILAFFRTEHEQIMEKLKESEKNRIPETIEIENLEEISLD